MGDNICLPMSSKLAKLIPLWQTGHSEEHAIMVRLFRFEIGWLHEEMSNQEEESFHI